MKQLFAGLLLAVVTLPAPAAEFPIKGKSLGGVVRAAPGMQSRRLGYLRENTPINIVRKTDVVMNDYAWFQIECRGGSAYQWGGVMCAEKPVEGIWKAPCE